MWQVINVKKIQKILSSVFYHADPGSSHLDEPVFFYAPSSQRNCPLLLSSPHSGRCYSDVFLQMASLGHHELARMEDRFVDLLLENAPMNGITLIHARFPRSFCDANRDWRELDATMFSPPLSNAPLIRSPKVSIGYGVIPRCAAPGKQIYRFCLADTEAEERLASCWVPYHQILERTQKTLTEQFGFSVLLDIHSMPPLPQKRPCDIVLGNLHGRSCSPVLIDFLDDAFTRYGYHVQRNTPYAGGYITNQYGKPHDNCHALQIEINRACYINLSTLKPNKNFANMKKKLQTILSQTAHWLHNDGQHLLRNI